MDELTQSVLRARAGRQAVLEYFKTDGLLGYDCDLSPEEVDRMYEMAGAGSQTLSHCRDLDRRGSRV